MYNPNPILSKEQITELVYENIYLVDERKKYISRGIDCRYENSTELPALSIPGGDMGELAVLYATGNAYGFEVDHERAIKILIDIVGGAKNFTVADGSFTTSDSEKGYLNELFINTSDYSLTPEIIATLTEQEKKVRKAGAIVPFFSTDKYIVGALLMVKGEYGIYPQYTFFDGSRRHHAQVYVYQQTLINERRKQFIEKLLSEKAVTLFEGCDSEYLYEILSEVGEEHLLLSVKNLAAGIPVYGVDVVRKDKIDIQSLETL